MSLKLTIELVPSTSWYSSLCQLLPKHIWDKIRFATYKESGYMCVVCGYKGMLNCHEVWRYDDEQHIQFLDGFVALCRYCHLVKHIGFASDTGKGGIARKHFMIVNKCSLDFYESYVGHAFDVWEKRSCFTWIIDFREYADLIKPHVDKC